MIREIIAAAHLARGSAVEAAQVAQGGLAIIRENEFAMWLPKFEGIARALLSRPRPRAPRSGGPLGGTEETLPEPSRPIYRRLRLPDSETRILLQNTSDTKTSKERMHLDLETDDIELAGRDPWYGSPSAV